MKGTVGQVLLWIGFLGGAYVSVCRMERTDSPWSTIPWDWYALCVGVGTVGVVLLRRDKMYRRALSAASETSLESVRGKLQEIEEQITALVGQLDEMTCEEVLTFIDDRCVPVFAEFADGRTVIANRFGTSVYAEVMTEFASGERYVNRAWSAAADGYVDEVVDCVRAAQQFLHAANVALDAAMAT